MREKRKTVQTRKSHLHATATRIGYILQCADMKYYEESKEECKELLYRVFV